MNFRGLFLILLGTALLATIPAQAAQTGDNSPKGPLLTAAQNYNPLDWIAQNKPKAASIAAALGIGAFWIHTWKRNTNNGLHMPKDALAKKIYPGPTNIVAKMVDDRKLRAYRDRQVLLPAILDKPQGHSIRHVLEEAFNDCAKTHRDYIAKTAHEERMALEKNKERAIALHIYIISPGNDPQLHSYPCYHQQSVYPECLYIKNSTNPKKYLRRELLSGECAIIGFSDGTTQIHINNTDVDSLIALTDEQHAFIVSLSAHARGPHIDLTKEEAKIFKSLNRRLRTNLASNYTINQPADGPVNKQAKELLGFGALLLNCALFAQKWHTSDSKLKIGFNFVTLAASTVAYITCLQSSRQEDNDFAWQIPTSYCAVTQAFERGPALLNKLASYF